MHDIQEHFDYELNKAFIGVLSDNDGVVDHSGHHVVIVSESASLDYKTHYTPEDAVHLIDLENYTPKDDDMVFHAFQALSSFGGSYVLIDGFKHVALELCINDEFAITLGKQPSNRESGIVSVSTHPGDMFALLQDTNTELNHLETNQNE